MFYGEDPIDDTQREAWDTIQPELPALKGRVLGLIKTEPRNADELVPVIGRVRNTVAPVCTMLRQEGLIKDSGVRRPSQTGRPAIVWQATTP